MAVGQDILTALTNAVSGNLGAVADYATKEATYFEAQAAMLAKATADGEYDDEQTQWFLGKLQDQAEDFCRALCARTILTLEEAWNAVVGVIWKALGLVVPAVPL